MRHFPIFNVKEIKYIYNTVMQSKTELMDSDILPSVMKSFTPFKNDLENKLNKYENVLKNRNYLTFNKSTKSLIDNKGNIVLSKIEEGNVF